LNAKEARARTAVLVVEDNPVDVQMIQLALREERNWSTDVVVIKDGESAIQYLLRQGPYSGVTKPDMLILDLNIPKRHGTEILQLIRTNEQISDLPVIVLSSSPEDVISDIVTRSRFTADLCLTKPVNVKDYLALGSAFRKCYEAAQADGQG
jgi:two-component system, chemotaxis family, response regulator Rcp1